MYDTVEEAQQKLVDTVVCYKDAPVYVVSAKKGKPVNLYSYYLDDENQETYSENINNPEFDFRNLGSHLGYMNLSESIKDAIYLTRMAIRRSHQTQGLSKYNLHIPRTKNNPLTGTSGIQYSFNNLIRMKTFVNMFRGEYPTLKQCKLAFSKESDRISAAFSRCLAVSKSQTGLFNLEWKGQEIGFTEDFDQFKLGPNFKYLQESLEDHGLKVV